VKNDAQRSRRTGATGAVHTDIPAETSEAQVDADSDLDGDLAAEICLLSFIMQQGRNWKRRD
jgi:hypothetical protein